MKKKSMNLLLAFVLSFTMIVDGFVANVHAEELTEEPITETTIDEEEKNAIEEQDIAIEIVEEEPVEEEPTEVFETEIEDEIDLIDLPTEKEDNSNPPVDNEQEETVEEIEEPLQEADSELDTEEEIKEIVETKKQAKAPNHNLLGAGSQDWNIVDTLSFMWVVPEDSSDHQTDENGTLKITPSANGKVTARLLIDFAIHGNSTIQPGELEIRIPKNVFAIRDGKESDVSFTTPFGSSGGSYSVSTDGDYIVFKNNNELKDAARQSMTIDYTVDYASSVLDSQKSEPITLEIKYDGQTDTPDPLYTEVDTTAKIGFTQKRLGRVYNNWRSEWGSQPTGTDGYWFAVFYINADATGVTNQPYTLSFVENPADGGKVIGYTDAFVDYPRSPSEKASLVLLQADAPTMDIDVPKSDASDAVNFYVVVGYPVDTNQESAVYHNTVTAKVTPKDGKDDPMEADATAEFPYQKVTLADPPGNLYLLHKAGLITAQTPRAGALDRLVNDKSSDMLGYYMRVGANNFTTYIEDGKTYAKWGKEFTAELIDDLVFLTDPRVKDGTPTQLTSDDYEVQMIEPKLRLYNWQSDYATGKYNYVLDENYEDYPDLIVYGKKSDTGPWEEIARLRHQLTDRNNYELRVVPGSITNSAITNQVNSVTDYERIYFEENSGYVGVRYSVTANKGNTDFTNDPNDTMLVYFTDSSPTTWPAQMSDAQIYFRLKPTETVKEYAQATIDDTSDQILKLDNFNTLVVKDENGNDVGFDRSSQYTTDPYGAVLADRDKRVYNGQIMAHRLGQDHLTSYVYSSSSKKKGTVTNDVANRRVKITYELTANENLRADADDDVQQLIADGIYAPQNSGVFYDLLPKGVYANLNSAEAISSYDYMYSSGKPEMIVNAEVKHNYKDTGRDLVIFKVHTATGQNNYRKDGTTSGTIVSRIGVKFDAFYEWDDINDYGTELFNPMAYETDNKSITNGKHDQAVEGDVGSDNVDLLTGLDENYPDILDQANGKFLYNHCINDANVVTEASAGLTKRVRSTSSSGWGTGRVGENEQIMVPTAGTYQYRLRFQASSASATDLVLYDSLENLVPETDKHDAEDINAVAWRGTFEGVDVSAAIEAGVDVKTYYTTKEGLVINQTLKNSNDLNATDANVDNADIWKPLTGEETEAEKEKITGLAFDMRKSVDGSNYVLPQDSAVQVIINMKAPKDPEVVRQLVNDAQATEEGIAKIPYAYNGVSLRNVLVHADGTRTKNAIITTDYTRVGLYVPEGQLEISKRVEIPNDLSHKDAEEFKNREFDITITDNKGNAYEGEYMIRVADVNNPANGYYLTRKAGVYVRFDSDTDRYFVLERNNNSDVYSDEDGNTTHPDGTPIYYYRRYKATKDKYTFTTANDGLPKIKQGQSVVINALEGDIEWIVVEVAGTDYTTKHIFNRGDEVDTNQTEPFITGDNTTVFIEFINTPIPEPGYLEISKIVESGDKEDYFTFTVTIKDDLGNDATDAFAYTGPGKDETGTIHSGDTVQLKDGESVTITLPADYTYQVVETVPEGYAEPTKEGDTGTIEKNQTAKAIFRNNVEESTISIPVNKLWEDDDNKANKRPTSITVNLLADGKKVQTTTLTEENAWAYTFMDLPEKEADNEIEYTLEEVAVDNYKTTITGDAKEGFTITNTYQPDTKDIEIVKISQLDGVAYPIYQAQIEVRDAKGNVVGEAWKTDGKAHIVTGIVVGEIYTLEETEAPFGFAKLAPVNFQVEEEGKVTLVNAVEGVSVKDNTITMVDARNLKDATEVAFLKTDESGKNLAGARFQILTDDGNVIDAWVSGDDYHKVELAAGKYTLVEIEAPKGYQKRGDIAFAVDAKGNIVLGDSVDTKLVMAEGSDMKIINTLTNKPSTPGKVLKPKTPGIAVPYTEDNFHVLFYVLLLGGAFLVGLFGFIKLQKN